MNRITSVKSSCRTTAVYNSRITMHMRKVVDTQSLLIRPRAFTTKLSNGNSRSFYVSYLPTKFERSILNNPSYGKKKVFRDPPIDSEVIFSLSQSGAKTQYFDYVVRKLREGMQI